MLVGALRLLPGPATALAADLGHVSVRARSDAHPWVLAMATELELRAPSLPTPIRLVIGPDGTAGPASAPPGRYELVVSGGVPGHVLGDRWEVDLRAGEITTLDLVLRSEPAAVLVEVLGPTGARLGGVGVVVHRDGDGDGEHEQEVARTRTLDGRAVVVPDLLAGGLELTIEQPPAGLAPGEAATLVVLPGTAPTASLQLERASPPTTTTTTVPPTTTTSSTTPTSTSTTSTATSTTSTSTTAPATTATTATTAPAVVLAAPAAARTSTAALPRTGVDVAGLGATGAGLVLLGLSLRWRRPQ